MRLGQEDILVLVLAGGQGRRIGGGKPLRRLGGETLLERAWRRARKWSSEVVVGVQDAAQLGELPYPTIEDDLHVQGPLASLSAGLRWASARGAGALLTIASDTPFLPDDLPQRLAASIGESAAAVAASGGRVHPTCALWRVTAASRLGAYLDMGRCALGGFAEFSGYVRVDWRIEDHDSFMNINTSEELAAAQALFDKGA